MTVVTQFLTHDGTDNGDLVEMRRLYLQVYAQHNLNIHMMLMYVCIICAKRKRPT